MVDWEENFAKGNRRKFVETSLILKILKSYFSDLKYKSVLECGFGANDFLDECLKLGCEVSGFDISKTISMEKQIQLNSLGLTDLSKIEENSFKNYIFKQSFDIVTALATLQFADSKEQVFDFMQKMKKYTNIGGINILYVGTHSRFGKQFPIQFETKDFDLYRFDKNWEVDFKLKRNFLRNSQFFIVVAKRIR